MSKSISGHAKDYPTDMPGTREPHSPMLLMPIEKTPRLHRGLSTVKALMSIAAILSILAAAMFLSADTDHDSLSTLAELTTYGTNPRKADSDGDGIPDGVEAVMYPLNPEESTHPLIADTDDDGLLDGEEVNQYHTDPLNIDTENDWLSDYEEVKIYHSNPFVEDTDGDYISDFIEARWVHSDPAKLDTDGGGLDDFNEVYTYEMDPNDPEDDEEFMKKIPYVEAIPVDYNDGGTEVLGYSKTRKIVEISMRDKLVQWFANNTIIEWDEETGEGHILIPDGPNYEITEENSLFPAYQLTHGRKGTCGPQSLWNSAILRLKGYKTIRIGGYVPVENGTEGHAWIETYKDGKVYIVTWGTMYPRDDFYKERGWKIWGYYDPLWYEEN